MSVICAYYDADNKVVLFTSTERTDAGLCIGRFNKMPEARLEFVTQSLLRNQNIDPPLGLSVLVEDSTT